MDPAKLPEASFTMLGQWFAIAPDAMIAVDHNGTVVLANTQAERIFGYAPAALHGLVLEALLPESLRSAHRAHRRDHFTRLRTRPMGTGYELLGRKHDGQSFPVEVGLSPVATPQGIIMIASIRDISDTRRVRQQLMRERRDNCAALISRLALESPDYELAIRRILELATSALELSAAAILSTGWRGGGVHISAFTGLSSASAQMLSSTLGNADFIRDAVDTDKLEVITFDTPGDAPLGALQSELALAGFHDVAITPLAGRRELLGFLIALAAEPRSLDQDKVKFLQSIANLLASAMSRSQAEEQLAHAQRLDAIGQLTGGVAHDFNNLLTVVSGNLQLLEIELAGQPELQEIIDSALRAVDRGSSLTRRLLTFARRQPLQPRAVVPRPLMEELGTILRRTLGEAIQVRVDCAADVPDVYADPNELDTALVNLALNARDAMPRGGRLVLAARETILDNGDSRWKLPPGRYVAFAVDDTGTGMSPDAQTHAFEPFFTTKAPRKGSGLGLSMVYGFATQSSGSVTINSRLGYGTRVELLLPTASRRAEDTSSDRPAAPAPQAEGQEVILVVEDEADVRIIATRFLGAVGYRVVAAASAREALNLLLVNPNVDLLFSDVVLGSGMDGMELAREARRLRPELPILLSSGYQGPSVEQHHGEAAATFELLRKPYRREQLLAAIRRVLGDV
jgi:PAS domain S-box-containing protein